MRYGSVCSGIEAATVAWHSLGWRPAFFSEIEAFPRAVLSHHYPQVPLHGDFTTIGADEYGPIDLLVGGTPCQSFSVAGLRGGMDDERGQLALQFLKLLDRTRARWVVWENVPGVLSSNGGRDFGSFLGGLVELGYGFAYRVLDAQYFGVPQRRRRVFVVGHLGDWRRAAAVLFERHSLSGHPAPRREARESVAALTANGVGTCGADDNQGQAGHLVTTFDRQSSGEYGTEPVASTVSARDYKGPSDLIAFAQNQRDEVREVPVAGALAAEPGMKQQPYIALPAVAFNTRQDPIHGPVADPLGTKDNGHGIMLSTSAVRRLTPRECERLQGFPDDYTLIPYRGKPAADGPRYKALGNSMAVPVMRWIGERIQMVEALQMEMAA